jgi:RHS repeat-associated protein
VQNEQLYSVICDHLGTPRELLDVEGTVVWSVSYKAWGKVEEVHVGEVDCPIRFQGQWADEESGLYYTRSRYYEPQGSHFISPDLIGLLGGLNIYLYAINPTNWSDPFGFASSHLFRGDNNYSGGPVGRPLGSSADVTTPWDHVRKESNQTSIFTSFSTTRNSTKKFASENNIVKVSLSDINDLQQRGIIKVHSPDDVAEMMRNHPDRRVRKDANNVRQIMQKNNEVLIEGEIPESVITKCK